MEVKTYRAKTIQDALQLVRRDLGPGAAVLHTREVSRGLITRFFRKRQIEITASVEVNVPSRLPVHSRSQAANLQAETAQQVAETPLLPEASSLTQQQRIPPAHEQDYGAKFRKDLKNQISDLQSMVEGLCRKNGNSQRPDLPESMFRLFTDMIDAEVSEDLARELIDRLQNESKSGELEDSMLAKARIARMIEEEIQVSGPIQVTPGTRRLVALVGPTGVGKTTTIAKLAANYRLREKRRVGLITVDTYRIAAVEQLRTYADIIDLPMEVVSTPKEMREAVARLSSLDLILMDTAGRSPQDEIKIQELKSMLSEAQADEVHLVLSSGSSSASLSKTAKQFAEVGTTSLVLTKLDEATGLGNLLPLLRSSKLPLSYVTNGQNVPDDIQAADKHLLARTILGMEPATSGFSYT